MKKNIIIIVFILLTINSFSQKNVYFSFDFGYSPVFILEKPKFSVFDISDSYIFGKGSENGESRYRLNIDNQFETKMNLVTFRIKLDIYKFYISTQGIFRFLDETPFISTIGYNIISTDKFNLSINSGITIQGYYNIKIGTLSHLENYNDILLIHNNEEDYLVTKYEDYDVTASMKNTIGFTSNLNFQFFDKNKYRYCFGNIGFLHYKNSFQYNQFSEEAIFFPDTYTKFSNPVAILNYIYFSIGLGISLEFAEYSKDSNYYHDEDPWDPFEAP